MSPKFLRPFQLKYRASGKSIVSFPYLQLSAVSLSQASGGTALISHCQETASLMSLPPPASLKRPSKSKPGKIMPMLCQHSHQRNLMCPSGKAHIFAVHPTHHPIPPSGALGSRTLLFGIAAQSAGQSAQTGSDLSDINL